MIKLKPVLNVFHSYIKKHSIKLSFLFLLLVLVISFIPVVALVSMWLITWYTGNHSPWMFQMMDECIKIVDHIWSAQIIAGVMAYGAALVDNNNDGVPDEFEKQQRNTMPIVSNVRDVIDEVKNI